MKLLVTTGCGNVIQGGADIWVNHFINLITPYIGDYFIFVDGRKPVGWDSDMDYIHFHYDDVEYSEILLDQCDEIHFLHANYHKREHLWKHKSKWENIFVHAYLPDMLKYGDSLKQFNTNIDTSAVDDLMKYCKKRIWIGLTDSQLFTDYPNNTITIPNFYEFKQNKKLIKINNNLGFTSRIESRKNIHYLDGLPSYVLSGYYDWKNINEAGSFDFSRTKYFKWNIDILESFMNLKWSISHSCHTKEPFGYSIFQAVDYGKLPILHSDWGEVDYKYRAESKEEFKKIYEEILSDNSDTHLLEFNKLKKYLKRFDNKKEWVEKISVLFNS